MHLKYTELNTEFINTLIKHLFDIPAKYITKATFTNHSTQIYLINSSIVNIFFQRFLIAKKNIKFAHSFIRNNIPFHTRIRGRIVYHAYINKKNPYGIPSLPLLDQSIHTCPLLHTSNLTYHLCNIFTYLIIHYYYFYKLYYFIVLFIYLSN